MKPAKPAPWDAFPSMFPPRMSGRRRSCRCCGVSEFGENGALATYMDRHDVCGRCGVLLGRLRDGMAASELLRYVAGTSSRAEAEANAGARTLLAALIREQHRRWGE